MKKATNGKTDSKGFSRRDFIKTSAAATLAAMTAGTQGVFAAGSDKLRVGLIACGDRGTAAAKDCLNSSEGVEIVAMGDLFRDHLDSSLKDLKNSMPDKVKVTPEHIYKAFKYEENINKAYELGRQDERKGVPEKIESAAAEGIATSRTPEVLEKKEGETSKSFFHGVSAPFNRTKDEIANPSALGKVQSTPQLQNVSSQLQTPSPQDSQFEQYS